MSGVIDTPSPLFLPVSSRFLVNGVFLLCGQVRNVQKVPKLLSHVLRNFVKTPMYTFRGHLGYVPVVDVQVPALGCH